MMVIGTLLCAGRIWYRSPYPESAGSAHATAFAPEVPDWRRIKRGPAEAGPGNLRRNAQEAPGACPGTSDTGILPAKRTAECEAAHTQAAVIARWPRPAGRRGCCGKRMSVGELVEL